MIIFHRILGRRDHSRLFSTLITAHVFTDGCVLSSSDVGRSGVQGGCEQQSGGGVGGQLHDHRPTTGDSSLMTLNGVM